MRLFLCCDFLSEIILLISGSCFSPCSAIILLMLVKPVNTKVKLFNEIVAEKNKQKFPVKVKIVKWGKH